MNSRILENKKVCVNNTVAVDDRGKGFSNHTEFVYDKHFRRKAFFRHLFNNREFRTVVLTGISVALTLFTMLILVIIPLMRNLIK